MAQLFAGEDKISLMTAQGRFHEDVFGATQQAQIEGAMASASGRNASQALLTAAQASNVQGMTWRQGSTGALIWFPINGQQVRDKRLTAYS